MSSIQHILDKEAEAERIVQDAEKEALEIRQKADRKQEDDLKELSVTLEKERTEKIDHQKGQLVQKHKEITDSGKVECENILAKANQKKQKAIDLVLEHISH